MRFIFHNPHDLIWYKSPFNLKFKKTGPEKYVNFFNWFLRQDELVYVYLDKSSYFLDSKKYFKYYKSLLVFYGWILLNGMSFSKFKILNEDDISENDFLFMFVYGNLNNDPFDSNSIRAILNNRIANLKSFKIAHLTHYMYNSNFISINSEKIGIDLFVAESNLFKNSKFFKQIFSWYKKDVYCLPFTPKNKFVFKRSFKSRIPKAVATGTITLPIEDEDFVSFFNSNQLHPMREQIFNERTLISDVCESFISPIVEKIDQPNDLKQRKYFSLDFVELYNNYQFFIVPEEVSGLPGIGFVEGMACGSVFIGLKSPIYSDIGMVEGVHYIGYDGTLSDLISKIKYYQKNTDLLNQISQTSYLFVKSNLNIDLIVNNFFAEITFLLNKKNENIFNQANSNYKL